MDTSIQEQRLEPLSATVRVRTRPNRHRLALLLIWLVALGVRLALSQTARVVWGDEPFYLWLGRNLVMGEGLQFMGHADVHHGPLFPIMAGGLYLLVGNLELASEWLYVLFGSLLVLPVYGIGRQAADDSDASVAVGLAAAALTAVFPALTVAILHWGTMTEPIYMFFVYVGLWAGLRTLASYWLSTDGALPDRGVAVAPRRRDPWWAYALAGLAFGLAYLTRPEAIGYVAMTAVVILALRLWRSLRAASSPADRFWSARFWLKLGLYVLGFVLCFLPYAIYVRQHTGAWMVSEKVGVAYLTGIGLAHGDTAAFDRSTWGLDSTGLETFFFSSESYNVSMVDLILADPGTFVRVLYLNVQRFVQVLVDWALVPYLFMPLVVLGLLDRGWTRERTIKELYLLLSMAPVLAFTLFFIQARYIVAVLPVFILWIARGLVRLGDWLIGTVVELKTPAPPGGAESAARPFWHMPAGWRGMLTATPVAVAIAVLLAAYPAVLREVMNVGSVRMEHRTMGEALAPLVTPEIVVMSRYPAIAFHAGARWVPTPNASWPEVLAYARHKGATYWAIDERELTYRPQFTDLVAGEQPPKELEVALASTGQEERLVIYRFVPNQ